MWTVADQVAATYLGEKLTDQFKVFRVVIAQERLMQFALFGQAWGFDIFRVLTHAAQRILARVIHGRGHRQWGGCEGLYLVRPEVVGL